MDCLSGQEFVYEAWMGVRAHSILMFVYRLRIMRVNLMSKRRWRVILLTVDAWRLVD